MMLLYRIVSYLVYIAVFPYARYRVSKRDVLWRDRLGLTEAIGSKDIWIHAASVGEVRIISYLIDYLKKKRSSLTIHLTVMTRAGYSTAKSTLHNGISVSYLPLDVPLLMRRLAGTIEPKVAVIAETEIWPHLVESLADRRVPIVLVNGRLSSRSLKRYLWFKRTFLQLLARYDRCFVKSDQDQERFLRLGVRPEICEVAGDMKFDAPLLDRDENRRNEIRRKLGISPDEFLLVAGSTRTGEEEVLLDIHRNLRQEFTRLRLLLVPRHLDRVPEIVQGMQLRNVSFALHSSGLSHAEVAVIIIDRMGMLNDLYLASDLAFVGGTLADIGGHNVLEPVWAGTPALFGPSISNVREAADYIKEFNYGMMVSSPAELESVIARFIRGEIKFHVKSSDDLAHSPTAHIGEYILRELANV